MKHLAAYLLLLQGGNTSPSAADVKAVLGSVGIDADEDRLAKLISELEAKSIPDLIAEGSTKLAAVPSGVGAGAPAAALVDAALGAGAAPPVAEPTKEEEKDESDDDMGFGLFD